jgi:hypothetical protein
MHADDIIHEAVPRDFVEPLGKNRHVISKQHAVTKASNQEHVSCMGTYRPV